MYFSIFFLKVIKPVCISIYVDCFIGEYSSDFRLICKHNTEIIKCMPIMLAVSVIEAYSNIFVARLK